MRLPKYMAFMGDSIMAGSTTMAKSCPIRLQTMLNTPYPGRFCVGQRAVIGKTAAQVVTDYGTYVQGKHDPNVYALAFGMMIGINDILAGTSAVTIEGYLTTIYDAERAQLSLTGTSQLVPCTLSPFGQYSGWTSPFQTVLTTVNVFIASYVSTHSLQMVDAYTLLGDTGFPQELSFRSAGVGPGLKPDYATPDAATGGAKDGLHCNDAGAQVLAVDYLRALTANGFAGTP